jgi:hypothetical protein
MNDLNRALGDISTIRRQMARSTEFRGYGPATLACTGLIAVLAAVVQLMCLPQAADRMYGYLAIWISTACLSASLTGVQMYTRTRRMHSGMTQEMMRTAVEQFLPAVGAGLLMTIVMAHYVPAVFWMIPGMWQVIFSLGIFSSCRFLPRPLLAAGAWYLVTGLFCISLGGNRALSPWAMGIPFGAGQLLVAALLLLSTHEGADES